LCYNFPMVNIQNPVSSTWIFAVIFGIALIFSIRRDKLRDFFPISTTEELKGLAILTVIFGHIGYFLVSDQRFLYPLSIASGVGVDLFLFLSGFGLTVSTLKKSTSIAKFYLKRLPRLFVPFWIVLTLLFLIDFFFLKVSYPWDYIVRSFFGIFTRANIYIDINSPLWYFTVILFYYLVYPMVFSKKAPWVSALVIYLITYLVVFQINPSVISQVKNLYQVHLLAFPLGIVAGWGYYKRGAINDWMANLVDQYKAKNKKFFNLAAKMARISSVRNLKKNLFISFRYFIMALMIVAILYTSVNSGVGNLDIVGYISMVTVLVVFALFVLKKIDFKLLSLLGVYSYEIYLLHWPILLRFNGLYKCFPAWLATVLYLLIFLSLAWVLHKITEKILRRKLVKLK